MDSQLRRKIKVAVGKLLKEKAGRGGELVLPLDTRGGRLRHRSSSRGRARSRSASRGRGGELILPLDKMGGRVRSRSRSKSAHRRSLSRGRGGSMRSRSRSKSAHRSRSRSHSRSGRAIVLSGLGVKHRSLSRKRSVSRAGRGTPAQNAHHALAKKAMNYKLKHGVSLKQAWKAIR